MSVKNSPRHVSRKKIPDDPEAFPLFFRLWGSKTEEDAAAGVSGDILCFENPSLTVLNPDFDF